MHKQKTDIYVFSGTGNTLLVARKINSVLNDAGCQTALHLMERSDPEKIDPAANLGLAFPVAAQSTYPLVWDFCQKLPQNSRSTPVFMADTLAGFSGGIVEPLKKLLISKGYDPVGACEIIMPNNFLCKKINLEKNREIITKGLQKAEQFAQALVSGKACWKGLGFGSGLLRMIGRIAYPQKGGLMRRFLTPKLDKEKCTRCGLCRKICPVSNIVTDANEYPIFADHCLACMRCFGLCPSNALRVRSAKAYFAEGITAIEE